MSEATGVVESIRGVVREAIGVPWTAWVTYLVAGASTVWLLHVPGSVSDGGGIPLPLASLLDLLTGLELGPPGWLQDSADWFDRIGPQLLHVLWLSSAAFLLIGATYANTGGLQAALGQLLLLLACDAAGSLWPYVWVVLIGGLVAVVAWIAGSAYEAQKHPKYVARAGEEIFLTFLVLAFAPAYLFLLLSSMVCGAFVLVAPVVRARTSRGFGAPKVSAVCFGPWRAYATGSAMDSTTRARWSKRAIASIRLGVTRSTRTCA